MRILGIDEAGKGSVIGPMVISGVLIESKKIKELRRIGVKDSKELSPKKREMLYTQIKNRAILVIKNYISPKEIDKNNLTLLELKFFLRIIKQCCKKIIPDKIIIDMPVPTRSIRKYIERIKFFLTQEGIFIPIIGENGADKKFIPVSAASIIAKVCRDRAIQRLKTKYGDFGSGYPSDKKTIEFLKNNTVPIIRKKWKLHI